MTAKPLRGFDLCIVLLPYVHCQVWLYIYPAMSQDITKTHCFRKAPKYNFWNKFSAFYNTKLATIFTIFRLLLYAIITVHGNCCKDSATIKGIHTASAKTESSIVKGLLFFRKLEELKKRNQNHTNERVSVKPGTPPEHAWDIP